MFISGAGQKSRLANSKSMEKIEIWKVYNEPRASGLKKLVWTGLVWVSSGRNNGTNGVRNLHAWVNQNACFALGFAIYTLYAFKICDIHTLSFLPPPLHTFSLHLRPMETKTIMEYFETHNLTFLHLVCLSWLKSKVMFLILYEIFLFFLTF
jgi:hypothetical protein